MFDQRWVDLGPGGFEGCHSMGWDGDLAGLGVGKLGVSTFWLMLLLI